MAARLEYGKLAPEGLEKMRALEHYLNTATGLEPVLLDMVRLRASLLNGCEYCIQLHAAELRKLHEPEERIAGVADWRGAGTGTGGAYTQRERAALAWAEAVTKVAETAVPDLEFKAATAHFSEKELADLTIAIGLMNAYNRMAISFRATPAAVKG